MDIFDGPLGSSPTQIHDFDPGIKPFPGGLFWTVAIPEPKAGVDVTAGTAFFQLKNFLIRDYRDVPNALSNGSFARSKVSFRVDWGGAGAPMTLADATNDWGGEFRLSSATIEWSAVNLETGFRFKSAPASSSTTVFAMVGDERNGAFFP
jgi:hypothetical protein